MDMHTENSQSIKPQASNVNKVYINPYFNSYHTTNTCMHFNPKFKTRIQHSNENNTSNTRIFINPNFVKAAQGNASNKSYKFFHHNVYNNVNNSLESNVEPIKSEPILPVVNVNKSRYSLVRHGMIKVKDNVEEKPSTTIKVNKYKSVPITDIKKKLMKEHNMIKTCFSVRNSKIFQERQKCVANSGHIKKSINRYKYVQHKLASMSFDGNKRIVNSKISISNSIAIRKNYKLKIKEPKKVFKKNNIPCPLFKKFGKCIRDTHGNCEFLHDKKHVTLCRKFLKGICFDTDCLLSHDLTTKKIPTCYFYLKGMCTKEDCPYVHIKLNDNTKICPDFLKGYCEKGRRCVNRHETIAGNTKKTSCYIYKKNEKPKVRKKSMCLDNKLSNNENKIIENNSTKQEGNITEGRYYEDQGKWNDNTNDISEVIKPTRCKLGSLPSFIHLHN